MNRNANIVATATNVLEAVRDGRPMTASAKKTMPTLVNLLRSIDEDTLATEIEEAMSAFAGVVTA